MKKIIMLAIVVALTVWLSGCGQKVYHEVHTQKNIQTVESQEIVVTPDRPTEIAVPASGSQETHTEKTVQTEETQQIVVK